jgi:putative transposase
MPRRARKIVGGYLYHVLNRANGRLRLFRKEADFVAFETIVAQAFERVPLRILGYVVVGNHWHFVVWPRRGRGEQVSAFFRWLSITHAQRWHATPIAPLTDSLLAPPIHNRQNRPHKD